MQNIIKGLGILTDISSKDLDMMEQAALLHKRHASIQFKIVEVGKKSVIIQAVQSKSAAGHYFVQKRLIEIVHETFDRFFTGRTIKVHAIPYLESPAAKVDALWVNAKMLETSTKLKDMANETGLDNTQLSALISGNRPMSQTVKAMFYFYFHAKQVKRLS